MRLTKPENVEIFVAHKPQKVPEPTITASLQEQDQRSLNFVQESPKFVPYWLCILQHCLVDLTTPVTLE
jgi:hypothetical protein